MSRRTIWLLVCVVSLAFVPAARGGFYPVEDFDCLYPGPIAGQNGWSGSTSPTVAADPDDPTNLVLAVTTDSIILRHPLLISQGQVRTLFVRFRIGELQMFSLGLSHLSHPVEFSDFGPEVSMSNASLDLRIRDDGQYARLVSLDPNTWYNLWLRVDNPADTTELWLTTGAAEPADLEADQLSDMSQDTVFAFRTGGSSALRNFFIKTGGGSSTKNFGPLYIDDIYLETTDELNLDHPANGFCAIADFDGNCRVDLLDLATLTNAWLTDDAGADIAPPCGDGIVNLLDFTMLAEGVFPFAPLTSGN